MHRAAEVTEHDVTLRDPAFSWVVVRAGGVRPGGDDREVGALVTGIQHSLDQFAVHVDLASSREPHVAHDAGDCIDRVRRRLQRGDLGLLLHDPQRPGDLDAATEPHAREGVLELDDEAAPGLVTDRGGVRAPR